MTRSASSIHRKCVNFLFSYSLFLFLCTYFLSSSLLSKVLLLRVFFIISQCCLNLTGLTFGHFFLQRFLYFILTFYPSFFQTLPTTTYELEIVAKDMAGSEVGLTGTATATITITDKNDHAPEFTHPLVRRNDVQSSHVGLSQCFLSCSREIDREIDR